MNFPKYIQILVLVLFPACFLLAMKQSSTDMPDMSQFEDFAKRAMTAYHVPGASIAIIKDGKIAYVKGFGYRDIEHQLPVTPETIFAIGSCTKAFTATAVGILVDQGKLDWDAPIKTYLPGFEMYDKDATENLSLRDCLCHRSGLPRYDCLWNRFKSRSELVANLRYLKSSAKFREKWQYNNLMYALVGHVIETITGIPWDVFVRENITKPFNMSNTYFSASIVPTHPNAALAYEFDKATQSFKHVDYNNLDLVAPAGSIHSSAIDMAQWIIMNLNGTGINSEVHKAQMIIAPGEEAQYCLGWCYHKSENLYAHNGGTTGCCALVIFSPTENTGVVVLSNIEDVDNFNESLAKYSHACMTGNSSKINELEEELSKIESNKGKEESPSEKQSFQDITPTQAAQFAGTYHNDLFGDLVINVNGSTLTHTYVNLSSTIKNL